MGGLGVSRVEGPMRVLKGETHVVPSVMGSFSPHRAEGIFRDGPIERLRVVDPAFVVVVVV